MTNKIRAWGDVMTLSEQQTSSKAVLGKAVLRAAEHLHLSQSQLAIVLRMDVVAITQLQNQSEIDPNSKQGKLALLLIRLYQALYTLTGSDREWIDHFLTSENRVTGGIPANQIETMDGLISILNFVESIRAK